MQQADKRLLAGGLVLAGLLWVLPATAGEMDGGADVLASLGALSAAELERERATFAISTTSMEALVNNHLEGAETVNGGDITVAAGGLGGSMYVSIFNTGPNTVIQGALSLSFNIEAPSP